MRRFSTWAKEKPAGTIVGGEYVQWGKDNLPTDLQTPPRWCAVTEVEKHGFVEDGEYVTLHLHALRSYTLNVLDTVWVWCGSEDHGDDSP